VPLNAREYINQLKTGLKGTYLFFGDEEYLKQSCLKQTRDALLDESTEAFNHVIISAANNSGWLDTLAGSLNTIPVFAQRKLVELHSLDYGKLSEGTLDELYGIISELAGYEDTILVLCALPSEFDAGRLPKAPSKMYKKLSGVVSPVEFERETAAKLSAWADKHFRANHVFADHTAITALIEYCSTDMFVLASEIDKLSFYTLSKGNDHVDPKDIPKVCSASRLTGAFDFTNAILERKLPLALELVSMMKLRREKPEFILSGIIDTVSGMYTVRCLSDSGKSKAEISQILKMHEYRVGLYIQASASQDTAVRLRDVLRSCLDADIKIKSTMIDNYLILDRLIIGLCRGDIWKS